MDDFLGVAWENILVGLLGGFAVSGFFVTSRSVRAWLIQRRFPVAGLYITKFEDEIDGERTIATAPATLVQRGRRISGTTKLDDREWVLQGELSAAGYIHGVYFARDPVDKGIGNFFLRIHNDRRMEGLWSGYDSVNDSITSGRYSFRPVRQSVTIRTAAPADALPVLRIGDDQLGDGYINADLFYQAQGSDNAFLRVAECDGKVVGFCLGVVQSAEEATAVIRMPLPRHLRYASELGVLKTIAVTPSFHGGGIGTRLTEDCLAEFRRRGIRGVYSLAWKSGSRINIKGVLERQGFTRFGEIPSYWAEDSVQQGYQCPSCGEPPCRCSAVMYSQVV